MTHMIDCYIITGPTASGKSAFAIEFAQKNNGIILNGDALQLYKGAPILTACPDAEDKEKTPHRLYEILELDTLFSAGSWVKLVTQEIKETLAQGKKPIIVGGSGFYILALIEGLSPLPHISVETRKKIEEQGCITPLPELYRLLQQIDPELGGRLHANDKQRILRGLEVFEETGIKLSEWQKMPKQKPEFAFDLQIIMPDREKLYNNCDQRFLKMIESGGLQEVEALRKQTLSSKAPIQNALGFQELSEYLNGTLSLEKAILLAQTKTRQFAKRQITWMKHQFGSWLQT